MRSWLVSFVVAGCYAPSIPTNVPCAPDPGGPRCPSGQVCIGEVCVRPGGDANADAANDDRDGDGLTNAVDNCPDVANADQHDEDGDARGDACDGCPPFADATVVDTDGDGVEDRCDPHPQTIGDKITLFESFRAGMPAGWVTTGVWTGTESVQVMPIAGEIAAFRPSVTPDNSSTSSAGIVPIANPGGPGGFGVAAPVSSAGDGLACLFFYPLAEPNNQRAGLVRTDTLAVTSSQDYAWVAGEPYTLVEQHTGSAHTCTVIDRTGAMKSFSGMDAIPQQAYFSVFTSSLAMRVDWVMHVDSP